MNPPLSQTTLAADNAQSLAQEILWFEEVLAIRFTHYFSGDETSLPEFPSPPDVSAMNTYHANLIRRFSMRSHERIVLLLSLLPHIQPSVLDRFLLINQPLERCYTEFGGYGGKSHSGFLPSCQTALFIIAGNHLRLRFEAQHIFNNDHYLLAQGLITIDQTESGEPWLSAALTISTECLNSLTSGVDHKHEYGDYFSTKHVESALQWDDLVLNPETRNNLENIITWAKNSSALLQDWGLAQSLNPGYRCLFYGASGTGKTLTATLIGKLCGLTVHRIDWSTMVSRYAGETEKNLAAAFDQAQNKNWILLFDHADDLFCASTESGGANNWHANHEIAYLLQRIENFAGLIIFASNHKPNTANTFARHLQASVLFAVPHAEQRLQLWSGLFRDREKLAKDVNLQLIAEKYELSGGAMTNVARYAAILATRMQRTYITQDDLIAGILAQSDGA